MACRYSPIARSRWPVTSKILPSWIWLQTSVQRGSPSPFREGREGLGGGWEVAGAKENLGDAVVGQRTVFVEIESFIELGKRGGEVSLLLQRLSAQNRSVELHI